MTHPVPDGTLSPDRRFVKDRSVPGGWRYIPTSVRKPPRANRARRRLEISLTDAERSELEEAAVRSSAVSVQSYTLEVALIAARAARSEMSRISEHSPSAEMPGQLSIEDVTLSGPPPAARYGDELTS